MVPENSSAAGAIVPPSAPAAKPPANSDGGRAQTGDGQQVASEDNKTTSTSHGNCFLWLWDLIKIRIAGGPQHDRPDFRPIYNPQPPGKGHAASEFSNWGI
ncbi:unnamed protein product [Urochloa humidicola]